uniref:Uncharacterized protein n=2 Tax=Avena sativa TaxID=4498 RepID=A0ACD5WX62_AVESA
MLWIPALTCFVTVKVSKDHMFHERTKHVDIKYHYVRDVVAQGILKVCKISIHDNHVDMMTKPIPIGKFELYSSLVGITVYPKWLLAPKVFSLFVQGDDRC